MLHIIFDVTLQELQMASSCLSCMNICQKGLQFS